MTYFQFLSTIKILGLPTIIINALALEIAEFSLFELSTKPRSNFLSTYSSNFNDDLTVLKITILDSYPCI
jgi:hypothetical protein